MARAGKHSKAPAARSEGLGGPRNPVPAEKAADRPFQQLGPDYPIKPRVIAATGERFGVVCLRQEDGRFVAEILEQPEIRYVGKTRRQAELTVTKMFLECRSPATRDAEEDRAWLELARANQETTGLTIDEYRRRRGI